MPVRVVNSATPSQVPGENSGHTSRPSCSLLSVGQAFSGTQNVSSQQKDEAWRVNVRIQGCDLDHGYLCGTMEALNVPLADTPLIPVKGSQKQEQQLGENSSAKVVPFGQIYKRFTRWKKKKGD